jgi:hypothetical protein
MELCHLYLPPVSPLSSSSGFGAGGGGSGFGCGFGDVSAMMVLLYPGLYLRPVVDASKNRVRLVLDLRRRLLLLALLRFLLLLWFLFSHNSNVISR